MVSVALWLPYMALEPMVRRRWPEVWVSWSRVISGRVWDPAALLLTGIVARVGFLAFGVAISAGPLLNASSLDFGTWHAAEQAVPLAALLLVAVAAFWTSLGGRSPFGDTV